MNLKFPKHVKQFFIERKYYRKYFYKVCFKVDDSKINSGIPRIYSRFGNTGLFEAQQNLIREIYLATGDDNKDYKLRVESRYVSLFTNDEKIISELIDKLPHRMTEFHGTINNSHKEVIDQSRRIRVRKHLFEKKFKYKVYFIVDWKLRKNGYEEVQYWLEQMENFDDNRWAVNQVLSKHFNSTSGYKGYTAAVYLNDPEDLMMCQMRFHSEIDYIEEAVLISTL